MSMQYIMQAEVMSCFVAGLVVGMRSTPPHALVTAPLKRALLEATVAELRRLRGEVKSLRAMLERGM